MGFKRGNIVTLTDKVNAIQKGADLGRIDSLLKRIEKFDDIQPDETIWSEQRILKTVRSYVQDTQLTSPKVSCSKDANNF